MRTKKLRADRRIVYPIADALTRRICLTHSLDFVVANTLSEDCLAQIESGALGEHDVRLLLAARHSQLMRNRRRDRGR